MGSWLIVTWPRKNGWVKPVDLVIKVEIRRSGMELIVGQWIGGERGLVGRLLEKGVVDVEVGLGDGLDGEV